MDDAVLGLVWVTSVCIIGHIATALYFSKKIGEESQLIEERITEIDNGIGAIAQWMVERFENVGSPQGIDWGSIISQLFNQNDSPNDDYNRLSNGQFNGTQTEGVEVIETTPQD